MNTRVIKYNPAFLSEDELIKSFVARHKELDSIIKVIGENSGNSNQHLLVIGARGLGKTSLVLRVSAEVRKNKKLSDKWYPLVFAEESYQVSTPGEFWLEAIFHLAQQTKDNRCEETFKELGKELNEVNLRERALGRLLDFADEQGKRILLVVENFNMLLGDQISDDDAWVLRQTLQNEPRIMLLATATSRFQEIDNADKAMFDLFKLYELYPLSDEECRSLWKSITAGELPDERIRPIKILTGGNPRLLTILASFGANLSFRELMNELIQLVDGHTEYFKNHLDSLPSVERKVYVALLEIWKPATASEVSKAARFSTNKTSAYLERLVNRGAVVVMDERGGKKWYQVAERMYNIYYLMRRRGGASGQISALVNFMVDFYKPEDLVNLTQRIAQEACNLSFKDCEEHYVLYEAIQNSIPDEVCEKIISKTPYEFLNNAPDSLKCLVEDKKVEIKNLLKKADELSKKPGQQKGAEQIYLKVLELKPNNYQAWAHFGKLLHIDLKRYPEAEQAYRKAIEQKPDYHWVWEHLGGLLQEQKRYEEAEQAYHKAIKTGPNCEAAFANLGRLLHKNLERYEEAEQSYRKVIELKPDDHRIWVLLGQLLQDMKRYDEAEQAYRKAIELRPDDNQIWAMLGQLLQGLKRYKETEQAYQKALELKPDEHLIWAMFGQLLQDMKRYEDAEQAYRKALELKPDDHWAWEHLGELLHKNLKRYEKAEQAYRKAIETGPDCPAALGNLTSLLLIGLDRPADALKLKEYYLMKNSNNPEFLNAFAWAFYKYGKPDFLVQAETLAQKAVNLEPNDALMQHTLASILCSLGKKVDALEVARKYLVDTKTVEENIDDSIDLFVRLAAMGYGKQALDVLRNSPSVAILEPLAVGLQLFIGEDVKSAAEIMEVAQDVAAKIKTLSEQLKNSKK